MSTAITINDIFPKLQYIANANQTAFSYNFPIFEETDLAVYRTPAGQMPDDDSQRLTLNSDYTVSGVGESAGGTVTMLITININDRITIQRAMPYERLSSYSNGRRFNPDSLDYDLNAIIMMMQQIWAYYEKRFPHYQNTAVDDTGNLALPVLSNGQFWKRNALGIVAATLYENADWSTLRSELADQSLGTDGARLIGYHDTAMGSVTVHQAINQLTPRYAVDSGVADAITVSYSPPFMSYKPGMTLYVKIADYNSGATTINVDGLGVKNVVNQSGDSLEIGNLNKNMVAIMVYDGANFILLNGEPTMGHAFSVGLNADFTHPGNGTDSLIKFDNASGYNYIEDEVYSIVDGWFIAKVAGLYTFSASICAETPNDPSGADRSTIIKINGNGFRGGAQSTRSATDDPSIPATASPRLNVGDKVQVYSHSLSPNNVRVVANIRTFFEGRLVRRT